MFLIGVRTEPTMVIRTARNAWRICVVLKYYSGFQMNTFSSMVFNVAMFLSFTYFLVIAQAVEELSLVNSELVQLAMSWADEHNNKSSEKKGIIMFPDT